MVKVSVIIPVYNVEKYVKECLASVMNQTLTDIEIICVEDCSTDNSADIIRSISCSDSRICIYYMKINSGLSAARNEGMRHASGEYIYFLDSDDMLESNALEILYTKASQEKLDILYFDTRCIYETPELQQTSLRREKHKLSVSEVTDGKALFKRFIESDDWETASWRQFYRRKFICDNNLRFVDGIYHEDDMFSLEAAMNAERCVCEPYRLHIYRVRDGSIMTSGDTLLRRLLSSAYLYNRYREYMKLLKNDAVYQSLCTLARNEFNRIVWYYRCNDSMQSVPAGWTDETETIYVMTCNFYGGFFPYKLSVEVMKRIRQAEHVVIYGAGKMGGCLLELLKDIGIDVDCFAFTLRTDAAKYMNHDVIEVSQLELDRDKTIMLIAAMKGTEDMLSLSEQCGYMNTVIVKDERNV